MSDENKIDPGHSGIRDLCRIVGPIILGIGILMFIIAVSSFFTAFGGSSAPKYFWCAFVGIPLIGVGSAITNFGFMGKVARYMAGEMAPVAKDTFNYMADGTKDGVETIATSIGKGIGVGVAAASGVADRTAHGDTIIRCHKCSDPQTADAKFCDNCGAPMEKNILCQNCSELNDPDARFCDNCGHSF